MPHSTAAGLCQYRAVISAWEARVSSDSMAGSSAARYTQVFGFFCRFLEVNAVTHFGHVDTATCRAFIYAGRGGTPPSSATSRLRLTVIRDAFRVLTDDGSVAANPTDGLVVPHAKSSRSLAPLTPAEAQRLRIAGRVNPTDSLRPATVELALLGVPHELAGRVCVSDLDLETERVHIGRTWRGLDTWGASVLRARVAACRRAANRARTSWVPADAALALTRSPFTYPATSIGPIVNTNLLRAMDAAGLSRPGLRPSSVREYAANRAYARSNRIEDVAKLLCLSSLDVAMRYIDRGWQDAYAEEVADTGQD